MSTPARLHKVEPVPSTQEKIVTAFDNAKYNALTLIFFVAMKFQKQEEIEQVRLAKKEEASSNFAMFENYFLVFAIALALVLFVVVCYQIIPPVESGLWYNNHW